MHYIVLYKDIQALHKDYTDKGYIGIVDGFYRHLIGF